MTGGRAEGAGGHGSLGTLGHRKRGGLLLLLLLLPSSCCCCSPYLLLKSHSAYSALLHRVCSLHTACSETIKDIFLIDQKAK